MSQLSIIKKTWSELGLPRQSVQYTHRLGFNVYAVTDVGILNLTIDDDDMHVQQIPAANPNRNHFYHEFDVLPSHWIKAASETEWISNNDNALMRTLIKGPTQFAISKTIPSTVADLLNRRGVILIYTRGFVWMFVEYRLVERSLNYDLPSSYDRDAYKTHKYVLKSKRPIIPKSKAALFDDSPYQLRASEYNYAIYQPNTRILYYYSRDGQNIVHKIPIKYRLLHFDIGWGCLSIVFMDDIGDVYTAYEYGDHLKASDYNYTAKCGYLGKFDPNFEICCHTSHDDHILLFSDDAITVVSNIKYTPKWPF